MQYWFNLQKIMCSVHAKIDYSSSLSPLN